MDDYPNLLTPLPGYATSLQYQLGGVEEMQLDRSPLCLLILKSTQ